MLEISVITIVGQVILPVVLLLRLWRSRGGGGVDRLLKCLATAAYLAMIAVAGVWLLLPWYLPYGYAILGVGAAFASGRERSRRVRRDEKALKTRLRRVSWGLVGLLCAGVAAHALAGRRPPTQPLAVIAAPLRGGSYLVANGGFSILINPHMKTLRRGSLRAYRGQSYAVDMVKLDALGFRARGFWPTDLHRYHIFGEAVYAPCDGQVIRVESHLPDLSPPLLDREHPAGNFVYLDCPDASILLAHLMHGSLATAAGDRVRAGQYLARVGNSGYSTEPHLHVHAQRRAAAGGFMAGEPIPLQIEDGVPVRNTRLTVLRSKSERITPGLLP